MVTKKSLTKGQVRKLNALRKSLGDKIAEKAFAEWWPDPEPVTALANFFKFAPYLIIDTLIEKLFLIISTKYHY